VRVKTAAWALPWPPLIDQPVLRTAVDGVGEAVLSEATRGPLELHRFAVGRERDFAQKEIAERSLVEDAARSALRQAGVR